MWETPEDPLEEVQPKGVGCQASDDVGAVGDQETRGL